MDGIQLKAPVFFAGWYAGILFFAMGIPINVHNQYHTAGGWFFGTETPSWMMLIPGIHYINSIT